MDTQTNNSNIEKTLKAIFTIKYIGLTIACITGFPIGAMIVYSIKMDSIRYIRFQSITIILILILILLVTKYSKRLKEVSLYGKEYLNEYMSFIASVDGHLQYSEYILWFSDYVRRLFIVEDGSYKLSTLHTLTYKDSLGLCPASRHKRSFQQLLKLISESNYDSLDDIYDQVEEYKHTILFTEAEKAPALSRRPHDPYVVVYIIIGLCYIIGAIISALDLNISASPFSLEIISFKLTTFISNLLFYMPLVFAEILVHKGYIKKKEEELVAEEQRIYENKNQQQSAKEID